ISAALEAAIGRVTLWTAGDPEHAFFRQLAKDFPDLKRTPQPQGDLGERMHQVFVSNAGSTLLLGSDCPVITPQLLQDSAKALKESDAVFLPAEDGGYALVGLHQPCRALFQGISWGGDRVMQQTREQLQNQGLTWCEPQQVWDVDLPEDVRRFLNLKKLQYKE
ncbi:TIGR04282 family arsenosugar biosynthesis glycosyltransferase, partial [Marinospirillum sp.]|uniref:TIGR04282 family arsenosugar biosynthesis glycosyltransferase n=1 Tax=Marinospirillum sp. TaxID=2183934 RepID=UPI0028703062